MMLARLMLTGGVAATLSGCIMLPCGSLTGCPAASPAFRQVEGLPPDEQSVVVARLPLEQRLDLYHDVYVRSGHPRRMLSSAFEGTGEAGVEAVLARMTSRSSFNEYFWIIHWMGIGEEVDVCSPHIFGPLSEKARQFHVPDPEHPVPIQFDGCVLPL